jgi:hypothetical protein
MRHSEVPSVREQVEAISAMAPHELQVWISDRLAGRDVILEDDEENSLVFPIIAIARHLPPIVAQALHRAVARLVRGWITDPSIWDGDDLLLLVQGLGVLGARDDLEELARSEIFRRLAREVQYRVLQTLISLAANVGPSFWYRVFETAPKELAGIAFDGLALVSPNHAVDFLSVVPGDSTPVEQITIALPGFMDNVVPSRDRAEIRKLVESRLPEMQPSLAAAITQFFSDEETPLAVLPLTMTAAVKRTERKFPISAGNFPALVAKHGGLDGLLGLESLNPAKMFAALAHQ